MYQIQFGLIIA
jgi:hypothetical protein